MDQDVLERKILFRKMKGVDMVIHLAAFISATESWKRPIDYIRNNALGTLSVINVPLNQGVKKMIFFSSAAVKAKPLTPYAVSKINAEEIVKLYSKQINSIIVRPENIYGPGQKANYGYVIHNFIKAVECGKPIHIYGDGQQTRDFIYIDDVIETINKLISINIKSGTVINLGTGKETKIIDLAKEIMKILNKNVEINHLKKRKEPSKSVADMTVLSELNINSEELVGLNDGINKLL